MEAAKNVRRAEYLRLLGVLVVIWLGLVSPGWTGDGGLLLDQSSLERIALNEQMIFLGKVVKMKQVYVGTEPGPQMVYTLQPIKVLRGRLPELVVVRCRAGEKVPTGANSAIFLVERDPLSFMHYRERFLIPIHEWSRVMTAVNIVDHPEVGFKEKSRDPLFLSLTSKKLLNRGSLAELLRAEWIQHYRNCADGRQYAQSTAAAVNALSTVGDADSAPLVAKLLAAGQTPEHERVAEAVTGFLAKYPSRETVSAMCAHLDRLKDGKRAAEQRYIAAALSKLEAKEGLPAIRGGVARELGNEQAAALGYLGEVSDFGRLLAALEGEIHEGAAKGLMMLVARSNLKIEKWMEELSSDRAAQSQKWGDWWETNQSAVKIVKTGREAGFKVSSGF